MIVFFYSAKECHVKMISMNPMYDKSQINCILTSFFLQINNKVISSCIFKNFDIEHKGNEKRVDGLPEIAQNCTK